MAEVYYPVGKYMCRIKQQGFDTTSTGKPQFVLTFTVFGTDTGDSVPQKDRGYFKVITEKTIEYLVKDLQNLGAEVDSLKMLDPNTPGHVSLVGKEVMMYCSRGTDAQGQEKEEWAPAFSTREMKPPAPAEMMRLDALFGRAMKSAGVTPKPAAPKPAPVPVAAGGVANNSVNDDVPF